MAAFRAALVESPAAAGVSMGWPLVEVECPEAGTLEWPVGGLVESRLDPPSLAKLLRED